MSRVEAAARHLWDAGQKRAQFRNLPAELMPASIDEAYAMQEAFHRLAEPSRGPVAGLKIATTTKVMQALMGIDHPCGGAIFRDTIHASPARLRPADFVNLRIECEIAVRLGADLRPAEVIPAFELIEDRHAVYKETDARCLIAENSWNAGIVLGPAAAGIDPSRLSGTLEVNGRVLDQGRADDPLGALAWLGRLVEGRGRPMRPGMLVMTGSLVPTRSVAAGDVAVFRLDGVGEARLELVP